MNLACANSLDNEVNRVLLLHVFPVLALEYTHGGKATRTHCKIAIGKVVTVMLTLDKLGAFAVDSAHDSVQTYVATVSE